MIRTSLNTSKSIKATTDLAPRKPSPHRQHHTIDSEERVNACLNCKKPASKCKGDCFGRNK